MRNKVIFMVGNIGSGKTTYTHDNNLCNVIGKDDGREGFGEIIGEEYLWDETLEEFIHEVVINIFEANLYVGAKEIVLDGTFMTMKSREYYLRLAERYEYRTEAVIFEDRGMKCHVDNRMTNPRGFDRKYWEKVWTVKHERYQRPTIEEGFNVIENHTWR